MPMSIRMALGTTMRIMRGVLIAGGSSIIPIESECITRNGLRTAIRMNTIIIGTIAAGGKNTTLSGRMSIIPIGSSI
jgi:hypothetical protein